MTFIIHAFIVIDQWSLVIGYWFVEQAFQPVELIIELSH
jgi:hypothetical protein